MFWMGVSSLMFSTPPQWWCGGFHVRDGSVDVSAVDAVIVGARPRRGT